MINRN